MYKKFYLKNKIFSNIPELWVHLSKKRKIQLIFLFFLSFTNGFWEIFTLITLIPFLNVITQPEQLFNYSFINSLSNCFVFRTFLWWW